MMSGHKATPHDRGDARLRAPRNQRELIRMFALYEEATGLDGLLARFNFSHLAAWSLDRVVLGPTAREPRPPADTDPVAHAKALLLSNPFRQFAVRNLLDAFPDTPRLLFVHVPKCAGTDLTWSLRERFVSIDSAMENPHWYTPEQRFLYLRQLVLTAPFADALFVRGHVPLRYYVNQNLVRPNDLIFTVLRDPTDVVISMINYVLTRFRDDPEGKTPDTRQWFNALGISQLPAVAGADWRDLGRRLLRERRVVADNILCNALGRGDAASALDFMVASDIETTDLARYEPWLARRWGIGRSARANESVKFIQRADLAPDDLELIGRKTNEDRVLFDRVRACLDQAGSVAIRGRALA